MPGSGVAAKPVFHSHENFSDTFADNICGIPGTSVARGVDNFTLYANNRFKDNFTLTQIHRDSEREVRSDSCRQSGHWE